MKAYEKHVFYDKNPFLHVLFHAGYFCLWKWITTFKGTYLYGTFYR